MLYFKFHSTSFTPKDNAPKTRKSLWRFLFGWLWRTFEANPDFESKFGQVVEWLIEYDDVECNVANREIGLDQNRHVIVKLPDERNYGYWLDTGCTLDDFKRFNIQMITAKEFCDLWNTFHYDSKLGKFVPTN